MVAHSSEFENIAVREEEQDELEKLSKFACPLEVKGGPTDKHGKTSILIQVHKLNQWFYTFIYSLCFGKSITLKPRMVFSVLHRCTYHVVQ